MVSRLDGAVAGVVVHIHAPMIPHAAAPVSRFSDLDVKQGNAMRVFTRLPMRHWRETQPCGARAEAAGFDAVMTVELGHDVFTPLAFAALATERIELTPSIAVAFPRSPTVMASQAWDLQANSNGRFVLGLGSQVKGHNERRFGIAVERAGAAAARLRPGAARSVALLGDWRKSSITKASTTS